MAIETPPVVCHAVTGNRLRDGVPVYFTALGTWSPVIDDAVRVADGGAEALLREAGNRADTVISPYLIEVVAAEHLQPVTLRERIRAFGPTVRPGTL